MRSNTRHDQNQTHSPRRMAHSWPGRKSSNPNRARSASLAFSSVSASPGCSTGTGPPIVTPRGAAGLAFVVGPFCLPLLSLLALRPLAALFASSPSSSSLLPLLSLSEEDEDEDVSCSTCLPRASRRRLRPRRGGALLLLLESLSLSLPLLSPSCCSANAGASCASCSSTAIPLPSLSAPASTSAVAAAPPPAPTMSSSHSSSSSPIPSSPSSSGPSSSPSPSSDEEEADSASDASSISAPPSAPAAAAAPDPPAAILETVSSTPSSIRATRAALVPLTARPRFRASALSSGTVIFWKRAFHASTCRWLHSSSPAASSSPPGPISAATSTGLSSTHMKKPHPSLRDGDWFLESVIKSKFVHTNTQVSPAPPI